MKVGKSKSKTQQLSYVTRALHNYLENVEVSLLKRGEP